MALGLTQAATEMSTRNISWRVKVASVLADNKFLEKFRA
jgi:hypothetical protein